MLAKKFRLTHLDFLLAKKAGKPVNSPDMNMVFAPNKLDYSRFSVVTSAKLDKRAVVRNRLRRQIYTNLQNNSISGFDVLLYPKHSMLNLSYAEIGTKTNSLLSKLPGLS